MKDGGSAFPSEHGHNPDGTWNQTYESGMTLRDYFAAQCMPHVITFPRSLWQAIRWAVGYEYRANSYNSKNFAEVAYVIADAMLAEREKP